MQCWNFITISGGVTNCSKFQYGTIQDKLHLHVMTSQIISILHEVSENNASLSIIQRVTESVLQQLQKLFEPFQHLAPFQKEMVCY
jgi:hypothetical protein